MRNLANDALEKVDVHPMPRQEEILRLAMMRLACAPGILGQTFLHARAGIDPGKFCRLCAVTANIVRVPLKQPSNWIGFCGGHHQLDAVAVNFQHFLPVDRRDVVANHGRRGGGVFLKP